MNVLVISQYYYPEPFRIHDICEELAKKGHKVMVLTGVPNYPMGQVYAEYKRGKNRYEIRNGVEIHRCFTVGRRKGAFFRFFNYYSYAISSCFALRKLKNTYDVVFVNQLSPVMMAYAGIRYKKKQNTKLVLYCLDLWPESLVTGGVKRKSFLYRIFQRVSEKIYKQADKILLTSKSFADYFKEKFGIENTAYLPQYADELFDIAACKKTPSDMVDLMFAGNIGVAQGVDTILKAANLTKDIKNLRWHIVGDGSELPRCKKQAQKLGLTSVIFHGRQPIEKMPTYYAMADAMLVTMQKDPILSKTLPAKIQSYMAAGKPIIGAIDGEGAKVIREANCGFCCEAENATLLADCVKRFVKSQEKEEMALNSAKYYKENFTKDKFMKGLIKNLEI